MTAGPLADLTVVEMGVHRAAPFCTAFLADLGADVVKIERPGVGDPARSAGAGPPGKTGYFMANNRNKRSVTIDLKAQAGRKAALSLLADADVFVENFGYGVTEKLGLGYEDVRTHNEELVYASIKGYGETGPMREKQGLDLIAQAEGGIMSVTGPEGGEPVKVGQAIGDQTAGLLAAVGVLARLHELDRSDDDTAADDAFVGKFDVGLFDAVVHTMNEYLTRYSLTGEVPGPQGRAHQMMVPYQLFETADGHVVTGIASDEAWDAFVDVLGREELREYRTNDTRREHAETVLGIIQEEFRKEPTDHWLDVLTEAGFPNGPLNDVADVVEHEQAVARGLVVDHTDPDAGECVLPGQPLHFPEFSADVRRPAPRLGEHTGEVFADVAPDQTTLDRWQDGGAFGSDESS